MINNRNIIIISSIDWTTHWQMHQQLATSFIETGNRVLFIENTGARRPGIGDIGRIRERIVNWLTSTRGFKDIRFGLTVFSPLFLPFPYSRIAGWINRFFISRSVTRWMRIARFHDPIVFTFLPTPLSQALIRDVYPAFVVYYCANDMAGSSAAVRKLRPWEDLLFKQANLVFVISESIRERASVYSKQVYSFPPGVDFAKFDKARENANIPEDLESLPRPIVGYVGSLSGVLDQDLLISMAERLPSVTFVLIGPKYTDVKRLESSKNIKLMGEKPHDQIPAYIKGFDVALIPYVRTSYTDSVYSCKLNEYLSMGIPVVSAGLKEVKHFNDRYGGIVDIADTREDFIRKVELAISDKKNNNAASRIEIAKNNSWDERFSQLSAVVENNLGAIIEADKSWQDRLVGYYRRNRIQWLSKIAFLLLIYGLLFYTPLVWYAGMPLVHNVQPKQADAIVVFGGHGEVGYTNSGYQRRTLEAVSLYKAGYAPLLIVSSSVQHTVSEADVMKAMILAEGVPSEAIILDRHAKNTFMNVEIVKRMLKERRVKSILLVTAPYHTRRALMTWEKNAPDIKVVAVSNIDSPSLTPQWNVSIGQIRVILYEYLAIVYNRFKGWI